MALKILIVGYGDLGAKVGELCQAAGYCISALRRTPQSVAQINMIEGDVTNPATLTTLSLLAPEVIIYCVSASGQTDEQYRSAYVDGLRHVLQTQQQNNVLKHVFFISSTRVYGQHSEVLLDENTVVLLTDFGGERLHEAEQLLVNQPFASTVLRLSGIYGPGRLRMIRLAQDPALWPQQDSWTNRIHRDDAARFIAFLVEKVAQQHPDEPQQVCYVVTDSLPSRQYDVIEWIANQLGLKVNRLAAAQARLSGKRLSNQRMLATGFCLTYPTYKEGYQALLQTLPIFNKNPKV